jgi:hypothetical protein
VLPKGPLFDELLTRNHSVNDHPTQGVKAAKPRLKPAKEELPKLSREYLEIRNAQMRTKNLTAEMVLAERRGELIEKRLVERQAAYLFVALRQAILNTPQAWCRRILGLKDAAEASRILREMAISVLNEIKDLPAKVTDPNWVSTVDGEEDGERIHPASGSNIRTEQAKARARRQNKTATEARRRARR